MLAGLGPPRYTSGRVNTLASIRARLAAERGTLVRDAAFPVALCSPSGYRVAMSSLGFQTIYREIHAHPGFSADRAFLPDSPADLGSTRRPLVTYEHRRPVSEYPLVAFSIAYELELPGVLSVLSLSGLPLLASERSSHHPLVVAGGPLTFSNPLPLAPFCDILVLGEAEETIHVLLDLAACLPKDELLDRLSRLAGFFVPSRGGEPGAVARAPEGRLPAYSQIVTADTELSEMFLVEPERGCSRGCGYCVMRRTTNGGMRSLPAGRVLSLVPPDASRVGLVGAAVTDAPCLPDLLRALVAAGKEVGVSSLRADQLDAEIVGLLTRGGARSLTTAADGASERLRRALDRKTSEADLLRAAKLAREAGLSHVKFYLMAGVPGETDADLDEFCGLGREISKVIPLVVAVSPFVAKRNTPMDGAPFEPIPSLREKIGRLATGLRGRAEIRAASARWAWIEYLLAQCGPEAGFAALSAWREGGSFSAWKRAVARHGLTPHEAKRVPDGRLRPPALARWPSVGAKLSPVTPRGGAC